MGYSILLAQFTAAAHLRQNHQAYLCIGNAQCLHSEGAHLNIVWDYPYVRHFSARVRDQVLHPHKTNTLEF